MFVHLQQAAHTSYHYWRSSMFGPGVYGTGGGKSIDGLGFSLSFRADIHVKGAVETLDCVASNWSES